MTLEKKKNTFIELGKFLSQFSVEKSSKDSSVLYNDAFFDAFLDLIHLSQSHNGWYTPENVFFAIASWAEALTPEKLNKWTAAYDFSTVDPKTIGLVLAGNIPLVGFHDFLSVLISGHAVLVKTSSNDQHLLPFLTNYLIRLSKQILFLDILRSLYFNNNGKNRQNIQTKNV